MNEDRTECDWDHIAIHSILLKTHSGLDTCGFSFNKRFQYNTDSSNILLYGTLLYTIRY